MERAILHCDCNCFFASVEMLKRPEYREVPMAVGGSREDRHGIILAKNEKAKAYGVKTAETLGSALSKCPSLAILPPSYGDYERVSRAVNALYSEYTDRVEPFGIDESYLDVTESWRLFASSPAELGDVIRERVKREIGVTVSVGVSFCKTFAKMGSDMKKPDATTVIGRADVESKIWPLPVGDMIFIGRRTAEALCRQGITTVGALAAADPVWLRRFFGINGIKLKDAAMGLEGEEVAKTHIKAPPKSVGNGMTFPKDLYTENEIKAATAILTDKVMARMKKAGMACAVVSASVRYPDFASAVKQVALPEPTDSFFEVEKEAEKLVFSLLQCGKGARAITVSCSKLSEKSIDFIQENFFDFGAEKLQKLESAVYGLKEKYGEAAVMTCAMMEGKEKGLRHPRG